jgi:chromosome segregation ATPase
MRKAFDQNVSRSKPRLRLGALGDALGPAENDLEVSPVISVQAGAEAPGQAQTAPAEQSPGSRSARKSTAETSKAKAPPDRQVAAAAMDPQARRERLKARLKAARENPRQEPLPPTVAEAGVLAVERISSLQTELGQLKALNLSLTQDLEGARRQAEKATEEARLRMEEAQRLASEMDARVALLSEMERELAALEAERDETLLSLQESRQTIETNVREREGLRAEIGKREQQLADSLAEEERMADELEQARDNATGLRRSVDALTLERDTLARQVAELTAERAELLEARKALESVHRALSQAAVR